MLPPLEHAGTAGTWDALDHLIDELVVWSRTSAAPQTFYREMLRRVIEALAARGACVWEAEPSGALLRAHFTADSHGPPSDDPTRFQRFAPAVDWALSHCEALALAPDAESDDRSLPPNCSDSLLFVQPFVVDDAPLGVILVEQRPNLEPDARRGALRLLATIADLTADYHRNRQRALFQRRAAEAGELEALLTALHAEIDVRAVAYAAAHEGRRWCNVDRVAVLSLEHKAARLLAVGGVESVDRRAESVRKLEQLATLVAAQRRPLRYPDQATSPPAPQVAQALADYVEAAEPRSLEIAILERASEAIESPIGLLVLEQFGPETSGLSDDSLLAERLETLRRHTGVALANALEIERIPLQRFWRALSNNRNVVSRRLGKAAAACAAVALLCGATFLIPARLTVEAAGKLQPSARRDIYAPLDGIVEEILVRHGDFVTAEMPLLSLRKPELELEQARVLGELQTAERRLSALRANRTSGTAADAVERRRRQELAAEEEQLKQAIAGSQEQLRLLTLQQSELIVRSPIAGRVTTWDPERLLAGRPVARGDALLHIADESGPWTLELDVPQQGYDDVARALRGGAEPPVVEFVVATRPEQTHIGKLVRLAEAAETSADEGTRLAGIAEFHRADVADEIRRPGTSVSAKIDCGSSSLGSVSTRDLLYYLRTRWWF
ncbi:MAG: hypothetical protein C0483_19095 [Pirellula sp.]|nr:hypothetical protein [Pirellula sp.]